MMGTVQLRLILAALFSLHALDCEATLQGASSFRWLSCVNDFIDNVTCTWDSSSADPSRDCWITGHKKMQFRKDGVTRASIISRSCRVKERASSPPGCSFVFESNKFTPFEKMPNISLTCDRLVVLSLKDYLITSHIQMHPPGLPNVTRADNDTVIWWGPSSPLSEFLNVFDYQVHIQQSGPKLKAHMWSTSEAQVRIPAWQLKGEYQVRVRVKPANREGSQWSEWSPTTSWVTESENQGWGLDPTFLIFTVCIISAVFIVVMLAVYKSIVSKRLLKAKPVPNPSKYFQTLHSVHSGNLKKWLNPHYAAEISDATQPLDHISPVEVCESCDTSPFTSSSTCVPPPPSPLHPNRLVENSSSASSCFSNLDYFVSSSSGSSLQTNPKPANFTYKDEAHVLHKAQHLHLSLHPCPALTDESPRCESLKSGTQSPDSGFCLGKEDVDVKEQRWDATGEEDHLSSSNLSLPLNIPVQISSPSSPPSLCQISPDNAHMQTPMLAAYVGAAGWAVASAMYRSSSMPVESNKAGYFILQEIQTTSSNASI
ncbi:interleukin-2 receptor subunit beta isoform X2 [Dunckerocampus dactyliophorus]|uniref:interleukin-2 receptor subunit beta isoform X2 n=1 Tax=Dunckerocampus dactyliophorus TaxID=161453 RepID=UPI002405CEFB|nr:interleukin-2 receptor subunit beta isoform X2 [Dunckerocampus dactyliophorus]